MKVVIGLLIVAISVISVNCQAKEEKKKSEKVDKELLETYVKRCPVGWVRVNHEKCLKFIPDLMTQSAAELHCSTIGANLVSVRSESERQLVKSLVLKENDDVTLLTNVWIGLRRKLTEFYWTDLSSVNNVELNDKFATELFDCATLGCDYATLSNDTANYCSIKPTDCNVGHPFICQKFLINDHCRSNCKHENVWLPTPAV